MNPIADITILVGDDGRPCWGLVAPLGPQPPATLRAIRNAVADTVNGTTNVLACAQPVRVTLLGKIAGGYQVLQQIGPPPVLTLPTQDDVDVYSPED